MMYLKETTFMYDNINEYNTVLLVIIISLSIGLIVYFTLHLLIGYGGGLVASNVPPPFL